jgi:hypothetical protein
LAFGGSNDSRVRVELTLKLSDAHAALTKSLLERADPRITFTDRLLERADPRITFTDRLLEPFEAVGTNAQLVLDPRRDPLKPREYGGVPRLLVPEPLDFNSALLGDEFLER